MQNGNNVNEITTILKDKFDITSYENLRINPTDNTQNTLKDFVYLRRDWSFLNDGEEQIRKTVDSLKQELSNIEYNKGNALFLGCGVGRLAFEFIDLYSTVYATDKSFSMIWHLQKLLNGESISFFNPQEKNIHNISNVAQRYEAKIPNSKLKNKNKFRAFVSDVLDIPFQSNSIDSIFSIYFSDVIALKLWYQQINDKLSNDGLFIHFGPLDYFFSDEREMLSAEEFRTFFEANGYVTLCDKIIETPHLNDSNSISYKVYRNWLFIAQKKNALRSNNSLKENTILAIENPIQYERKGILKNGEHEKEVVLKLPNGMFSGAHSVIQILKLINGQRKFHEIIKDLQTNGFKIDDIQEIKDLIELLINNNVLKIKN